MANNQIFDILTRNTGVHRFVDIEDCPNWKGIITSLLNENRIFNEEKPSVIYLEKFILNFNSLDISNSQQRILTDYYRYLIASNLVNHLIGYEKIEKSILTTFRFGEKSANTIELLQKLKTDLCELKCSYESYSNYSYIPKKRFLGLDSLIRNIEMYSHINWFCNLYFNTLDVDITTATILNDYIASRIGGSICCNLIYDSSVGYPSTHNQTGILIQNQQDYTTVKLKQFYK